MNASSESYINEESSGKQYDKNPFGFIDAIPLVSVNL